MLTLFDRVIVASVEGLLRVCRLPLLNSPRVYALLGISAIQPLLERHGRRRALAVHRLAAAACPAYAQFLVDADARPARRFSEYGNIPPTDKENYVKRFSIEARCRSGRIPSRGVVIDESSGSSGVPNNWVRGRAERRAVQRLLQHGFTLTYPGQDLFLLNCFALGPWATGMNVSMSLADRVVLKSIGPDKAKLENTLRVFGPRYRYAIAGYPPFLKDWIDSTDLDLAPYEIHLIVGGEGISEGLRDHFLRTCRSVRSSYGASDLEINIGAETELSIHVRRLCALRPALAKDLFGREDPPMLFQFNPLDYFIEQSPQGELVFTLLRRGNVAPKIRYNIHDLGGMLTHRDLNAALARHGVDTSELPRRSLAFPFLFVYGRSDLTIAFFGAKVRTADVDSVLNNDPELRAAFHSFQMSTAQDAALNQTLILRLERARDPAAPPPPDLAARFYTDLSRVNQDFREVSRMFGPDRIAIEVFDFGEGPFADRDNRVKHRYID